MKMRLLAVLSATTELLRGVHTGKVEVGADAIGQLLERNDVLIKEASAGQQGAEASLEEWRVYYTEDGDDEVQTMRFQAEDMAHAIEQFEDASSDGDRLVGAMRVDSFNLVPTNGEEFEQRPGRGNGSWISLRNISIHLFDRGDECSVDLLPLGRETDFIDNVTAGYSLTALNALVDGSDAAEDVRAYCEAVSSRALKAHLAELEGDGEGIHDRLSGALSDLLEG